MPGKQTIVVRREPSYSRPEYEIYSSRLKMKPYEEIKGMAVVLVRAGDIPKGTVSDYEPEEVLAYISHDNVKRRDTLKLAVLSQLTGHRAKLHGTLNKKFPLYTGLRAYWNVRRHNQSEDFRILGKKYWVAFQYLYPSTDRVIFNEILREELIVHGIQEKVKATETVDKYAKHLLSRHKDRMKRYS